MDEARLGGKQRDAVLWEDVAGKLAGRGLRREVFEPKKVGTLAKDKPRDWASFEGY